MSRTLTVAGLLIDSWRDRSLQAEPSEMALPDEAMPSSRFRGAADDGTAAPLLMSLIELGAMQWEPS